MSDPVTTSVQQVPVDQLGQQFGERESLCIQQQSRGTVRVPYDEYVRVNIPVTYQTTLKKRRFMDVAVPQQYSVVNMSPQTHALNSVCDDPIRVRGGAGRVTGSLQQTRQSVRQVETGSRPRDYANSGSCLKGPYVSDSVRESSLRNP